MLFFGIHVMLVFDLPVCRVAIRFSLEEDSDQFYYIDISGVEASFRVPSA